MTKIGTAAKKVGKTMYARLDMTLSADKDLSFQMPSSFHGALMEQLEPEYAAELHSSQLHPYTQHLERKEDEWHWVVTALNERACQEIIEKKLLKLQEFKLNKHQIDLKIMDRRYTELSKRELAFNFYQNSQSPYISLRFLTPTAFKYQGRYINYPELSYLYSNLMNKYDAADDEESMQDEDTLEQLIRNTSISRYDLHSIAFSMEGIRIPAFLGTMTLRIHGTQTMCNFANMLFQFSEYSGIGIKTALGMGAVRYCDSGQFLKN